MHTHQWLQWRYATKKFDTTKEIPEADLTYILEAGNLAATSYGLQPFKIILVTDPDKKAAIVPHAYGQAQVGENGALLIVAARTDVGAAMVEEYAARIETVRGLPAGAVDGYKAIMVGDITTRPPESLLPWAQRQAYIALGTMMVAAAEKQIDHCPMEGFDPVAVNGLLGLGEHNLHATAFLALGYRHTEDATQHYAKVRRDMADIVVRM